MLKMIMGDTAWSIGLFYASAAIVIGLLFTTLFAVIYHRIIYPRFRRPRYNPSVTPRCSIIIPCKGIPKDLRQNLETFINLDYPQYNVIYAVESECDPAVSIIRSVIAAAPAGRATLTVAGLTVGCAQKNFNQLAALPAAYDSEIYVFADADIGPRPGWLRELILPLSDPKVTVATGFRWLYAADGKLGGQAHSFQSNLLYVLFCAASAISNLSAIWGGSMAIRKKDFEELGVGERWAETVVDDFSLSKIVQKKKKKAVLVTTCVTATDDALEKIGQGVRWFERQVMYLKAYHGKTWLFLAIPLVLFLLGLQLLLPASFLIGPFLSVSPWSMGAGASLLFSLGFLVSVLLHPLLGVNPTFGRFVLAQPFSLFIVFIATLRTTLTNTITWSNVKYKMTSRGRVKSVQRL